MYLHAKENQWKAAMFVVRDLDTGKLLEHVLWANDETGEYAQYLIYFDGDLIFDVEDGEPIFEIKKGNIKLEEKKR